MSDPNSLGHGDASGQSDDAPGPQDLVNPYQPAGSVGVLEPMPPIRGEINQHSQTVNRTLGSVSVLLILLGFFVWLSQGAPLFAALILMSPFYPAPLLFLLRPCRHAWWSDMLINIGLSIGLGVGVIIAGVVICTAIFTVGMGGL